MIRRVLCAVVFTAVLGLTAPVSAEPAPSVRIGEHRGFVRVVYEFAASVGFTTTEQAGILVVSFATSATVPDAPRAPRNVLAATGADGEARLRLAPGTHWRSQHIGNRIVIDVFDAPPPASPLAPAVARKAAPRADASAVPRASPPGTLGFEPRPEPQQAIAVPGVTDQPAPIPTPAPVIPVQQQELSAPDHNQTIPAPAETMVQLAPGGTMAQLASGTLFVPFEAVVGAAAFHDGDTTLLVFDDRRAIDLVQLRDDAVWGHAVVQLLPEATLIRVPGMSGPLTLGRVAGGWSVAPGRPAPDPHEPRLTPSGLLLPGQAAGRVVAVPVETGRQLLVGTWKDAPGAISVTRRMPEFALLASWQGVVVDTVSDQITLAARTDGFIVTAATTVFGAAIAAGGDIGRLPINATRLIDLPTGTTLELTRRLQAQVASAARAGPQARTQDRLAAAQTMLALGLGPEAQSLLKAAAAQDPEAAGSNAMMGAGAIAAVLSGRPDEAAALDDPRFSANDEAILWRALRDIQRPEMSPGSPPGSRSGTARALVRSRDLLEQYPDLLRRRLLPRAAEAMAAGGEGEAADAVAGAHDGDGAYDLARAIRHVEAGEAEKASAELDRIVAGPDRRQSVTAIALAAELGLSSGRIDTVTAADAIDRAAYAWRGDEQEIQLRLRAAELRMQAGAWRPALESLREMAALYPPRQPAIRAQMAAVFRTMLGGTKPVRPIDLVTLAKEFPDTLPEGEAGTLLAGQLADALTSLDLPGRAGPVLDSLMQAARGPVRAALGARLAALRLEDGQPGSALATLKASEADGVPPDLVERRALVHARARAATDLGGAVAELATLGSAAGDDARAGLLEAAQDWRGARAALVSLLARTPASSAPEIVLRLATVIARSDDPMARRELRDQWEAKLPPGPKADMFRILTAEPVRGPADLGRAAREIALARAVTR